MNTQITEVPHDHQNFQALRQDAQENENLQFSLFSLSKVFLATKETECGILTLGFVVATPHSCNPNLPEIRGTEIDAIYIDPAVRRMGVAKKLMAAVLESIDEGEIIFAACRLSSIRLFEFFNFRPSKVKGALVYMMKEN